MRVNLLHVGLTLAALSAIATANLHFSPKNKQNRRIPRHRRNKSEKPNIVLILTDDQDVLLGSLKVMPKTNRLIRNQGALVNHSFSSTPMCCPSRSSILTGMYTHNHNVYTNNENCSSVQWQKTHETRTFATYLSDKGYRTGFFGKYLNEYNGTYIPPGWKEWVGLIRNSRYYNYSINFNGKKIKHGDNYYTDYLTDLIANDSVTFLKQSKQYYPNRPVLMMLSVPAPHGPEDAAPQYQHMFKNNTDHRTATWNLAPNEDKQWLLQYTDVMAPIHQHFTDMLHRKRLQTLQSVDDLVEKVYTELKILGELENTYIIYTSDHGYHLGQYGLVKGKAMPYDFDIRVPMLVRGPGIDPKSLVNNMVANIDLAPTILDMAGIPAPDQMDGRSMLRLLKAAKDPAEDDNNGFIAMRKPWRDTILIERGKVTRRQMQMVMRDEKRDFWSQWKENKQYHFFMTGKLRKLRNCSKAEYKLPCKPKQKWYCTTHEGRPRKHKCRNENNVQNDQPFGCTCAGKKKKMRKRERKKQRTFLQKHVDKDFRPKFLRSKRSLSSLYQLNNSPSPTLDLQSAIGFDLFDRRCRTLPNNTISCDRELYQNHGAWMNHKNKIEIMIKEYRKALEDLRVIRRHLKEQRPDDLSLFDATLDPDPHTGTLLSSNIGLEEDCDCEEEENVAISEKTAMRNELKKERQQRRQLRKKKHRRRQRKNPDCNEPNMKCFHHDDNHWQTPPKWNLGPFCFCPNANNNTYWCLRTVNQTHNSLYCEFITKFYSYYDFISDPNQMTNKVMELPYGVLQQLHEDLAYMKSCAGSRACTISPRQGQSSWKRTNRVEPVDSEPSVRPQVFTLSRRRH